MKNMTQHAAEIASGERFAFGKNWAAFLADLDDSRIAAAENSLRQMLDVENLRGRSFLDIGSGSGLFSLAARRLGAKVQSFDYDPASVACTRELKTRYYPQDDDWTIGSGSVLDPDYMNSLPMFDIVYSWGVLHHTGQMWLALEHAGRLVDEGGKLFIAIYNDQGTASRRWRSLKSAYNRFTEIAAAAGAVSRIRPAILAPDRQGSGAASAVSDISPLFQSARNVSLARSGRLGRRLSIRSCKTGGDF